MGLPTSLRSVRRRVSLSTLFLERERERDCLVPLSCLRNYWFGYLSHVKRSSSPDLLPALGGHICMFVSQARERERETLPPSLSKIIWILEGKGR
ncbi:hypothetical protein AMTRI_Chr09g35030 [Amborella trichopoda]